MLVYSLVNRWSSGMFVYSFVHRVFWDVNGELGAQRVFQDAIQIRYFWLLTSVSTNTTTSGINMIIIIKLVTTF